MPKHCPNCLQEYLDDAMGCADCGAELADGPPPALKVQKPAVDEKPPLKWVAVHRSNSSFLMDFLKSRLEAEGIPALLTDQETIVMDWMLSNALGGIKLLVPEDRFADAHDMLREAHQEGEAGESNYDIGVKCPRCGSKDVGEKTHRRLTWFFILLSILTAGMFLIPLVIYWYGIKLLPKVIICKQCRHTWIQGKEQMAGL